MGVLNRSTFGGRGATEREYRYRYLLYLGHVYRTLRKHWQRGCTCRSLDKVVFTCLSFFRRPLSIRCLKSGQSVSRINHTIFENSRQFYKKAAETFNIPCYRLQRYIQSNYFTQMTLINRELWSWNDCFPLFTPTSLNIFAYFTKSRNSSDILALPMNALDHIMFRGVPFSVQSLVKMIDFNEYPTRQ